MVELAGLDHAAGSPSARGAASRPTRQPQPGLDLGRARRCRAGRRRRPSRRRQRDQAALGEHGEQRDGDAGGVQHAGQARGPRRASRRASTSTTSPGGASSSALTSGRTTAHRWASSPSAGSTSAVGCDAAVISRRSTNVSTRRRVHCGRGVVGSMQRITRMKSIQVRTADGVRLVGMHITADRDERDLAIVLAHGFTVTFARPHVQRWRPGSPGPPTVVMVDFRGHGRSEGRTTAGRLRGAGRGRHGRWAREPATGRWRRSASRWAAPWCCGTRRCRRARPALPRPSRSTRWSA